ncbi:DUF262 domain-containing protein [Helicobacter sp. T3_23-1059]
MSELDKFSGEIGCGTIVLEDLVRQNITIPEYQRPYIWDSERVKILLEDLSGFFESNQNKPDKYLLGSLILCNGKDTLEVVDGQQRLVTLALILRVLDDGDSNKFLSNSKFQHNQSKAHIKENYDFIKSWFESKDNDKREIFKANLTHSIEFIYVIARRLDDAFIFFDSANAKGKRLEAYDLIKAFHLHALEDYNAKSKDKKPNDFAKEFELLAKENEGETLKMLFNDILTPARQWLRDKSNKIPSQMDIYDEFCTDIPRKIEGPLPFDRNWLGILQNFVGGADFFEYISHFYKLYKILKDFDFYQWLETIHWSKGFTYNLHIYIMSALIYLDKYLDIDEFNVAKKLDTLGIKLYEDYMLRFIVRAVFTLRCSDERISIETARNFAKEILPLIYYEIFDKDVANRLHKFIIDYMQKEKNLYEKLQLDTKEIRNGGGAGTFLEWAKEFCYGDYYGNEIPLHYKHLYKPSQGE